MALSTQIIHVVPIQITLEGSTATITCNDPRASFIGEEILFELNEANTKDPLAQEQVIFVVDDLQDTSGYDNYFNMSSAPPLERLVAWKRNGTTSRSLEMRPGLDYEVVAVAYSVPQAGAQSNTAVKVGHGRRRFQVRGPGAGGSTDY